MGSDSEDAAVSDSDFENDEAYDEEEDAEEEEEDEVTVLSQAQVKARNVQAMLSGSLQVARRPMVSGLKCQDAAAVLARPFRAPFAGATAGHSAELAKRLAMKRRFVPWGGTKNIAHAGRPMQIGSFSSPMHAKKEEKEEELPEGVEPLVLWEDADGGTNRPIVVDNMLVKWLRPHQREGVKFMFECVMGLRDFDGRGCILADDMGLGKTLQGITLLWTMLCQGVVTGTPTAKRALIVCPTSLVSNWDDECNKWLKGRVKTLPICESSRADVISSVNRFLSPRNTAQVMIVSYETFRIHAERFGAEDSVQLVMCDEAHRLKNGDTLTNKALQSVPCRRRVMLSGTPMQNHLDEFYSMVNFCNPGLLGTTAEFHKHYEKPILDGREPDATEKQLALAQERNAELSELVNKFVLRRTNTILSKHLPPKVVEVVCCKLSPLQQQLYQHFLDSKAAKAALTGKSTMVLAAITALKKLCNHPKLIYDMINAEKNTGSAAAGFESCGAYFQPGMYDVRGPHGRGKSGMCDGWEFHSGKFAVLARLLAILRAETKDRIVIISNYTQTLDLVQFLCKQNNYPHCRLDGGTSITKRQKLVRQFNDPTENCFVFLLSSKAGGCGINLIGGNRLVLFDPDWNPANDKQAAARCWRDGQKKKCYLYRLFATGSIEEKVFQRQLSKESLQNVVNGEGTLEQSSLSKDDLRKLFTLDATTVSDTHDSVACEKCPGKHYDGLHGQAGVTGSGGPADDFQPWEEQDDDAEEQKLETWGHHHRACTLPDPIMRRAAGDDVSFVFSLQVEGCAIVEEASKKKSTPAPGAAAAVAAAAAAPPAGGYRLGAGRPNGGGMLSGMTRPVAGIGAVNPRAPLSTVQSNVRAPTGRVGVGAGKPSAAAAAGVGAGKKSAAAKPKPKPQPKPKAKRKSDESESEEDFESETEEDEASESEEESAGESESDRSDEDEDDVDAKPKPKMSVKVVNTAAAAKAKAPPAARPKRAAAGAGAAKRRENAESADEPSASEDAASASESDGGGSEDEEDDDDDPVADSEEEMDAMDAIDAAAAAALRKRARDRDRDANRASAPGGDARAGVEVDAKRGRTSEGGGSASPIEESESESELAMLGGDSDSESSEL